MYSQLVGIGYLVTAVLLAIIAVLAVLKMSENVKVYCIVSLSGILIANVIITLICSVLWNKES